MLKIKFYSTWEPFSTDKGMNLMAQWDFPSLMFMIQHIKYDLISMIYDAYRRHVGSWKKKNQLIGGDRLLKSQWNLIRESPRRHREKWDFLNFDSHLCHITTNCPSLFISAMVSSLYASPNRSLPLPESLGKLCAWLQRCRWVCRLESRCPWHSLFHFFL